MHRLIDFIWVRDLTAPMDLGLNNRPFVPHINQGSPEAPLKFQKAPKLREPCSLNKAPDGPQYLISYYLLGPKRRNPDMYV